MFCHVVITHLSEPPKTRGQSMRRRHLKRLSTKYPASPGHVRTTCHPHMCGRRVRARRAKPPGHVHTTFQPHLCGRRVRAQQVPRSAVNHARYNRHGITYPTIAGGKHGQLVVNAADYFEPKRREAKAPLTRASCTANRTRSHNNSTTPVRSTSASPACTTLRG
jgi:hypothetical protein